MSRSPDEPRNVTLAFTPTVKTLQSAGGSRDAYARLETVERAALGWKERLFIEARDSFYIATVGTNGWPYVQHRGGPPGFLRVIDDTTLAFADFGGNRQYISTGNVLDNGRAALILMDYPARRRLKLWTHAAILLPDDDPEVAGRLAYRGYAAAMERIFRLTVVAYDWNCQQHITPRYTRAQIEALSLPSPDAPE